MLFRHVELNSIFSAKSVDYLWMGSMLVQANQAASIILRVLAVGDLLVKEWTTLMLLVLTVVAKLVLIRLKKCHKAPWSNRKWKTLNELRQSNKKKLRLWSDKSLSKNKFNRKIIIKLVKKLNVKLIERQKLEERRKLRKSKLLNKKPRGMLFNSVKLQWLLKEELMLNKRIKKLLI